MALACATSWAATSSSTGARETHRAEAAGDPPTRPPAWPPRRTPAEENQFREFERLQWRSAPDQATTRSGCCRLQRSRPTCRLLRLVVEALRKAHGVAAQPVWCRCAAYRSGMDLATELIDPIALRGADQAKRLRGDQLGGPGGACTLGYTRPSDTSNKCSFSAECRLRCRSGAAVVAARLGPTSDQSRTAQ